MFCNDLTDWDILTYKYDMLPNKLENLKLLEEMKLQILAEARRKIEDLVQMQIEENG